MVDRGIFRVWSGFGESGEWLAKICGNYYLGAIFFVGADIDFLKKCFVELPFYIVGRIFVGSVAVAD